MGVGVGMGYQTDFKIWRESLGEKGAPHSHTHTHSERERERERERFLH